MFSSMSFPRHGKLKPLTSNYLLSSNLKNYIENMYIDGEYRFLFKPNMQAVPMGIKKHLLVNALHYAPTVLFPGNTCMDQKHNCLW